MSQISRRSAALAGGLVLAATLGGCEVANQPYPADEIAGNTFYTSFQEVHKYLDPVSSFSVPETPWLNATYEPLLGYHYLKRPYTLQGLTAEDVPTPHYLDKDGKPLPDNAPDDQVATSVYTFKIKSGLKYQPHPAMAKDAAGHFLYQDLKPDDLAGKHTPWDFPLDKAATSTREVTAGDYVYEMKRMASPWVTTPSPIYSQMTQYIVGLKEFGDRLKLQHDAEAAKLDARDSFLPWHDLRNDELSGVHALDDKTLEVRIIGKFPQIKYWMALPFFAAVPWEAEKFYSQRGMSDHSITLNNWPIGTGPYMLAEQGPSRYVFVRNPNFRDERYPSEGMPGDRERGLLDDAGKRLPFMDKLVFNLEKEREPEMAKFMQGYYDTPDISRNDVGFELLKEQMDQSGRSQLIKDHHIGIVPLVDPNNWYVGFNWLDPVVGKGDTAERQERNRKLRQALSIATDWEEWCAIFFDIYGPAVPAMSPIPAGLFGYKEGQAGMNPVTHEWKDGRAVRRPLDEAKKLLAEAGYPDGRDAKTGQPLVLFYDSSGVEPTFQARLDWQVKQYKKLGIQPEIRAADFNRFQERMLKGNAQIYFWGWQADYPDPEDYLQLLTTAQGKVKFQGENASNYSNPEYDKLYDRMKVLPDGPERMVVIDKMVDILRRDSPWSFGLIPGSAGIYQPWLHNAKPTGVINDKMKYMRVDGAARERLVEEWNHPRAWPVGVGAVLFILLLLPARRLFKRREAASARISRMAAASSKSSRGAKQ
jgi:ABC-type transport system substrate-binding protein